MNKTIGLYLVIVSMTCLIIYIALSLTVELPDVYISNTSKECVKVINYGTDYSCEKMPYKYNVVWVK